MKGAGLKFVAKNLRNPLHDAGELSRSDRKFDENKRPNAGRTAEGQAAILGKVIGGFTAGGSAYKVI
jgi:hypothetical protein